MKAILWKEFRELAKWAALGLVGLLVAELYALLSLSGEANSIRDITLASTIFTTMSFFGCAAIGVGLGLLQMLPERSRDRWATLLHRPLDPRLILGAKLIAGTILYLAATVIPLIVSTLYVLTPGQFAVPFVPELMIPALCHLVVGLSLYFLAVLICLERSRWLGRRGILALSGVAIMSSTSGYFYCLPTALAGLAFLWAALGAVRAEQAVARRTGLEQFSLAAAILIGMYVVLTFVSMLFLLMAASGFSGTYRHYVLTRDGSIFIQTTRYPERTISYTTLEGESLSEEQTQTLSEWKSHLNSAWLDFRSLELTSWLQRLVHFDSSRYRLPPIQLLHQPYGEAIAWYFLENEQYFVGYDRPSRRLIGFCDAEGFKGPDAQPVPFEEPIQSPRFMHEEPYFYYSNSQVYNLSFTTRSLNDIYTAPNADILSLGKLQVDGEKNTVVFVATKEQLNVIREEGTPLTNLDFRQNPQDWRVFQVAVLPDLSRYFFTYTSPIKRLTHTAAKLPNSVLEVVAPDGRLLETYQLPDTSPKLEGTLISAIPSLLAVAPGRQVLNYAITPNLSHQNPFFLNPLAPLITAGIGILLAGFLCWRAKFGLRLTLVWLLVVAYFGLAGFLTFLLVASFPPRWHRRKDEAETSDPSPGLNIHEPMSDKAPAPSS